MRGSRSRTLKCGSKRKTKSRRRERVVEMKGTLVGHLQVQLSSPIFSLSSSSSSSNNPSSFQNLLESEAAEPGLPSDAADAAFDDVDFILSQDFFCTPDYITPDNQNFLKGFGNNEEIMPCPKSPEKPNTIRNKRCRQDEFSSNPPSSTTLSDIQEMVELEKEDNDIGEVNMEKFTATGTKKIQNYVSQSAVALRCRVMPPPCIKNPYVKDASNMDMDPLGNQRSKCAGTVVDGVWLFDHCKNLREG